jgi:hypothetical protein
MTKLEGMTNDQITNDGNLLCHHSGFGLLSSFDIRASSFLLRIATSPRLAQPI